MVFKGGLPFDTKVNLCVLGVWFAVCNFGHRVKSLDNLMVGQASGNFRPFPEIYFPQNLKRIREKTKKSNCAV